VYTHNPPPSRRVEHSRRIASHRMRTHKRHSILRTVAGNFCVDQNQSDPFSNHNPSNSTPRTHFLSLSLAGCFEFSLQKSEEKCCLRKRNDVDRSIDEWIDGWMDGWMARSCISMQHLVRQGGYPPGPTRTTRSFDVVHNTFTFSTALHAVQRRPQWE
jgi:hypothetical protein